MANKPWADYGLTVRQLIITANKKSYYKFKKTDKPKSKLLTYIKVNKKKTSYDKAIKNTKHVVRWYSKKNKKGRNVIYVTAKKPFREYIEEKYDDDSIFDDELVDEIDYIIDTNTDKDLTDETITLYVEDFVTRGGDIARQYITSFILTILQDVAKIDLSDSNTYNAYYQSMYKRVDSWLNTVVQEAEDDDEDDISDESVFNLFLNIYKKFYFALNAKPKVTTTTQDYAYSLISGIMNDIAKAYPRSLPSVAQITEEPLLNDIAQYCVLVLEAISTVTDLTSFQTSIIERLRDLSLYLSDNLEYSTDYLYVDAISDDRTKVIVNSKEITPIIGPIYVTPDKTKWEFNGQVLVPSGTDLSTAATLSDLNNNLGNIYNLFKSAYKFYMPAVKISDVSDDRTKVIISGKEVTPEKNTLYVNSSNDLVYKLNGSVLETYDDKDNISSTTTQTFFKYMHDTIENLEIAGFTVTNTYTFPSFADCIQILRDIVSIILGLTIPSDVITSANLIIENNLKKIGSDKTWVGYSRVLYDISSLVSLFNELIINTESNSIYIDDVSSDRTKIIVNGKEITPVMNVNFITKEGVIYIYDGETLIPNSVNTSVVEDAEESTVYIDGVSTDYTKIYLNGSYYTPEEGISYVVTNGDISYVYKYDSSTGLLSRSIDETMVMNNSVIISGITTDNTMVIIDGKTCVPLIGFTYSYAHDDTIDLYQYNGSFLELYNDNSSIEVESGDILDIDGITSDNQYIVINSKQYIPVEGIQYRMIKGNTTYIYLYDEIDGLYVYERTVNDDGADSDTTTDDDYPNIVKIDSVSDDLNVVIINGTPYKPSSHTKYVCGDIYYVYNSLTGLLEYMGDYVEESSDAEPSTDDTSTSDDTSSSAVAISSVNITLTLPDGTTIEPVENTIYTSNGARFLYSNGILYSIQ